MKENCIVCANEFENPNMERITCSDECRKKWREFLEELKVIPEEKRRQKIDSFLSRIYATMIVLQLRQ